MVLNWRVLLGLVVGGVVAFACLSVAEAGALFRCESVGLNTEDCEFAQAPRAVSSDASPTPVITVPRPLVEGEGLDFHLPIYAQYTGDAGGGICDAGGCKAEWIYRFLGEYRGGQLLQNDGGGPELALGGTPLGPLSGCTPSVYVDGGYVTGALGCTTSAFGGARASVELQMPPNATAAVYAVSPNIAATTFSSPIFVSISCTKGCSTAFAASVAGANLTGVTSVSDFLVTGYLPAGSYVAGTRSVNVYANPLSPVAAFLNSFTFATSAVTSVSPTGGATAGGTFVTVMCNAGCTGVTGVTLNGVACTGVSVVDDQHVTCTSGPGTGTGAVHLTGGSSPTDLTNGWTYADPPSLNALTYPILGPATPTGSTPGVTLSGTNMSVSTTCSFAGATGTTLSSSDSSHVTVRPPTTAAWSSGGIQCCNGGSCSNTIANATTPATAAAYYSITDDAAECVYAGEGYSSPTATGILAGTTFTRQTTGGFTGASAPTLATWKGGPGLTFTVNTNLQGAFASPISGDASVYVASDYTSIDSGGASLITDSNSCSNATGRWVINYAGTQVSVQNGTNAVSELFTSSTSTTYGILGTFSANASGAFVNHNNSAGQTGTFAAGLSNLTGWTIGERCDGTTTAHVSFAGHLGLLCISKGAGTKFTTGTNSDLSHFETLRSAIWQP